MREHYLAYMDLYSKLLPGRMQARFRLERLGKKGALLAITGPLQYTALSFEKGVAEKLVDDLTTMRVESPAGEVIDVSGDFVEPIQLQVVCQRLWQKAKAARLHKIHYGDLENVNQALAAFYEDTINDAVAKTSIEEDELRAWCEKVLIISSGTRGIVHKGVSTTGGIPNTTVDILENKYLIRKEERSIAQWYELTHDRLIKPIVDWKNEREKEKEKTFARLWQKAIAMGARNSSFKHLESESQFLGAFYETVIKKVDKENWH